MTTSNLCIIGNCHLAISISILNTYRTTNTIAIVIARQAYFASSKSITNYTRRTNINLIISTNYCTRTNINIRIIVNILDAYSASGNNNISNIFDNTRIHVHIRIISRIDFLSKTHIVKTCIAIIYFRSNNYIPSFRNKLRFLGIRSNIYVCIIGKIINNNGSTNT